MLGAEEPSFTGSVRRRRGRDKRTGRREEEEGEPKLFQTNNTHFNLRG